MKRNLYSGRENRKTGKTRLFLILVLGAALGFFTSQSQGQPNIYTMTDLNSSDQVNVNSQAGMFNWVVDGQNVLNQQWFWLGLGNAAPVSIDAISPATVSQPTANILTTTYANASASVGVQYLLTGSTPGSGQSDIGESITLQNTSASSETFHFYEYSDFNLGGPSMIQLGKNLHGYFDLADQEATSGNALSETVATPGANEGEAEPYGVTLGELNNGTNAVTLSNITEAGPGHVTWAFEWDVTLAPGQDFLISKDKSVDLLTVPEPASLSLLSLGLLGLAVQKFRKAK